MRYRICLAFMMAAALTGYSSESLETSPEEPIASATTELQTDLAETSTDSGLEVDISLSTNAVTVGGNLSITARLTNSGTADLAINRNDLSVWLSVSDSKGASITELPFMDKVCAPGKPESLVISAGESEIFRIFGAQVKNGSWKGFGNSGEYKGVGLVIQRDAGTSCYPLKNTPGEYFLRCHIRLRPTEVGERTPPEIVSSKVKVSIDAPGTVKPEYFGGFCTFPDGWHGRSELPEGVHLKDIPPSKIRIEHITPLLETYEKNLRNGTLRAAISDSTGMETFYLLSFIDDERFSVLLHDQYAERLFEEFGDKEPSAVLLYYRTGGNLEKLRALYKKPINDDVKKSIEACFFDASTSLDENQKQTGAGTTPHPLSIELSTKFRTTQYWTMDLDGDPPEPLFGGPLKGFEDDAYLYEHTTDKRDLYIRYENTSKNMLIQVEVPRRKYRNCWCAFNVRRNEGAPILSTDFWTTHEHETHLLTLYPGDCYIRKIDLNFGRRNPGHIVAQLFSDFEKHGVVLGDYWVGHAEDDFQITLYYECNYIAAKSAESLNHIVAGDKKVARSNSLELSHVPVDGAETRIDKERVWDRLITKAKKREEKRAEFLLEKLQSSRRL